MCWALVRVYNVHHVLVLRWLDMLTVRAGDDNCVRNNCIDIKAHRANEVRKETEEKLIVRRKEVIASKNLTFADWCSLMNGTGHWRVPNTGKRIGCSTLTNLI